MNEYSLKRHCLNLSSKEFMCFLEQVDQDLVEPENELILFILTEIKENLSFYLNKFPELNQLDQLLLSPSKPTKLINDPSIKLLANCYQRQLKEDLSKYGTVSSKDKTETG